MTAMPSAVIVDDDAAVATLHERFVIAHGRFQVAAVAHTGPTALEEIRRIRPDLVLLDFYLPGLSGLELLRELRAGGGDQPEVIAVTAARDVESVRQARAAGVRHYLVKPFGPAQLHDRLDEILLERSVLERSPASAHLDQSSIDALLAGASRRPSPLPKGLSAETLSAVDRAVPADGELSATEIGEAVGISRVAARRYLEHLASIGRVERSLDYATAGRPSVRYRARRTSRS